MEAMLEWRSRIFKEPDAPLREELQPGVGNRRSALTWLPCQVSCWVQMHSTSALGMEATGGEKIQSLSPKVYSPWRLLTNKYAVSVMGQM